MKRLSLILSFILLASILNSCYKTGEIIYQGNCKPVEMDSQIHGNIDALISTHHTFTYTGINRQLATASEIRPAGPQYREECTFSYDANNNLTEIRIIYYPFDDPNPVGDGKWVLTYIAGSKNSISDSIKVQFFALDGQKPIANYYFKFNAEFQLTAIINNNNNAIIRKLEYDNGGNCVKKIFYTDDGLFMTGFIEYSNYDNKINPGRTDRSLQIAKGLYSKNNPGRITGYGYAAGNPIPILQSDDIITYTYNSRSYPITRNNAFYASYDCIAADPNAPAPKN